MSKSKDEILIDHLDSILSGNESPETAEMIKADKELNSEWQSLLFAIEGIREAGVQEKVSAVHKQYLSNRSSESKIAGGVIRGISRIAVRVAACLLLLIGAVAVYKYSTVNSGSVFNDQYASFELNTSRGDNNQDDIEKMYREKNWQGVMNTFNLLAAKTSKSYFLAGMAQMELKNFTEAIKNFNQIIYSNAKTGDNYFQDEAEYYIALAYLANKETSKAVPLLKKIKDDSKHLYHLQVKEISAIDLKILDYKSDK